ncbi:hypothetical protein D9M70_564820 [compost metagenome]
MYYFLGPAEVRICLLNQAGRLVVFPLRGGNPKEVNSDTVGLGELHANANVLISRHQHSVGDRMVPRQLNQIDDDHRIDTFLLA